MKKKFLLIMFAFALFGIAQAQSNLHWPAISNIPLNWDPSNMSAFMTINIDGTELANPNIEMVAFMGDTQMSDGEMPYEFNGHYVYLMTMWGFSNPQANTSYIFKLYDHNLETELDWISPTDVDFMTNGALGTSDAPHALHFFHPGNIVFADNNVKAICVDNWDTSGDGELSYVEAAAVTTLLVNETKVFLNNTSITSFNELQYFTGLTLIDIDTFKGCTNLASVILPSTITAIRNHGFDGCSSLTSVNIPEGVTTLNPYAFTGCISLPTITIPSTVNTIGNYGFSNCTGLTSITVNATTPPTVAANGVFQNVSTTIPVYIPCDCLTTYKNAPRWNNFTNFVDPCVIDFTDANAKAICVANWDTNGDGELSYAEAEVVTTLSPSNTSKNSVFKGNTTITSLDELQYFTGLTSIEENAFSDCINLVSITLPESVTTIGYGAFNNCTNLASVNIPSKVTVINSNTFRDCSSLTNIILPDSLTSLGMRAFNGCSSLTSITIPSKVTSIGSYVFMDCSRLATANWPDGLSSVSYSAFNGCTDLTTITIPSSVTAIYTNAFYNCTGLISMVVEATTPPTLSANAFTNVGRSIPVYVPCESRSLYQVAEGWNSFTNIQGIDCPTTESQEFNLDAGWNWWSTYIEMNNIDGLQLLENALGDNAIQIKSQNRFLLYENNEWDGNLTALTNEQMYSIYSVTDGGYAIEGSYADPTEHTISLRKGWNWIGYVESTAMELNAALTNMTTASENDRLKSYNGFSIYYEGYGWYGELETMEPGQGYMMYVSNTGSLTYPSSDKGNVVTSSYSNVNKHWKPVVGKFPKNMNILAVIELNNNELRTEEAELAAFDENGECRGSTLLRYVEPINRYVAFLTVYGENEDAIHLRMRHEGLTYNINEQLTMMADEVVGTNRNPFTMTAKGAGLNEVSTNLNLNIYPNPTGQRQEVNIELPENMEYATVEIIDMMGRVIYANNIGGGDDVHIVSTPDAPGVYTLRIIGKHGNTYHGKLVVK